MQTWIENMAWLRVMGEMMEGKPKTQERLFEAAECIEKLAGTAMREGKLRLQWEDWIERLYDAVDQDCRAGEHMNVIDLAVAAHREVMAAQKEGGRMAEEGGGTCRGCRRRIGRC